ncbi:MAG: YraN family protein [Planctomycetes bacterium]|nr:YraN family protein [Planctomycetota bacterium]
MWPWMPGRAKLLREPGRLGRWGENQARRFLQGQGFKTLARNWRLGKGELDLVMAEGDAIVFVEVKSRADENFVLATTAVTTDKKRILLRTAKCFLRKYNLLNRPLRFDVLTVILGTSGKPQIKHYRNAFVP